MGPAVVMALDQTVKSQEQVVYTQHSVHYSVNWIWEWLTEPCIALRVNIILTLKYIITTVFVYIEYRRT